MTIHFDDVEWPFVAVTFSGLETDQSIETFLRTLGQYVKRGRCALLFDTTETIYAGIQDVTRWARREGEWLREHRGYFERNVCGVSFVFVSQAVRLVLSTIFLISPLPSPHLIADHPLDGRLWCLNQLRKQPSTSLRPFPPA